VDYQDPQLTGSMSRAANGNALDENIYNRLLRERIIFLAGEFRDEMANAICAQMLLLAAEDSEKDIYLYINSPGGSASHWVASAVLQQIFVFRQNKWQLPSRQCLS